MRAPGRSRAGCCLSFVIIGLAVTACTSPRAVSVVPGTQVDRPATTRHRAPDSTTAPAAQSPAPMVESCPPGCDYQSDADAVTALASSATRVAVVTMTGTGEGNASSGVVARTDMVLQGNPHALVYPATDQDVDRLLGSKQVAAGQSYVVFASYNRGGACLSALFSYDPDSQTASLIVSEDGLSNQIVLAGRVLSVPHSISLTDLEARMYPTTGVVYPSDAEEWYCPGP